MIRLIQSLFFLSVALSGAGAYAQSLAGDWVMHLYVGSQLFDDRLHVDTAAPGVLTGSITVPGRFTVPIQNVQLNGDSFSFTIEADEGHGKFHVRYDLRMHSAGDTFVGFATVTDDNTLLGGFVGQRQSAPPAADGLMKLMRGTVEVNSCGTHHHTECVTKPVCTCVPG
jgi:hypothetical protein